MRHVRPCDGSESNAPRSIGCFMLASVKPHTSDAIARYAETSTTALARVGRMSRGTCTRSAAVLNQRDVGQARSTTKTAQPHSKIPEPTELTARKRARRAELELRAN